MGELFESGKVVPVIDRCYPLSETGEAIRRLGEKQSKEKVIISRETRPLAVFFRPTAAS